MRQARAVPRTQPIDALVQMDGNGHWFVEKGRRILKEMYFQATPKSPLIKTKNQFYFVEVT